MPNPSAILSVLVGKNFACVKIAGRANFMSSPDFKTLLLELNQKGYSRFIVDLSECVLMDSTFLGVLAGIRIDDRSRAARRANATLNWPTPTRAYPSCWKISACCRLFKVTTGPVQLPEDARACTPESANPTTAEITRTSLEAHQTLMAPTRTTSPASRM